MVLEWRLTWPIPPKYFWISNNKGKSKQSRCISNRADVRQLTIEEVLWVTDKWKEDSASEKPVMKKRVKYSIIGFNY